MAQLIAQTSRANYWRMDNGLYRATRPNDQSPPYDNGAGYVRLDSLMRLKGESLETIHMATDKYGKHIV